jgi:hypothetical protein
MCRSVEAATNGPHSDWRFGRHAGTVEESVEIQASYVNHLDHSRSAGGLGSKLDESNETPHPTIRH